MENPQDLKDAVKTFYKNKEIEINEENIIIPEEKNSIIDTSYKDDKFQIKNVPGEAKAVEELLKKGKEMKQGNVQGSFEEINKMTGKTEKKEWGYNIEEFKEKYIKEPARKLKGSSGKNVILLLWASSTSIPHLNQKIISQDKKVLNLLKGSRFEEIYLVGWEENILLYKNKK